MTQSQHSSTETTIEEVQAALDDLQSTPRFADYRVDPIRPLVPLNYKRKLPEDYSYRFAEPYLDPDAFKQHNPIPDFMVTCVLRLLASALNYAFSLHVDEKMPHIHSYDLLPVRYEKLKALDIQVYKFDFSEEFDSELLAVRTKFGLVWGPVSIIQAWHDDLMLSLAEAALVSGMP